MDTVLVVDDESKIRKLIMDFLGKEGYRMLGAGNGAEAWKMVEDGKEFDAVILDVMMPEMDGWSFARKLKRIKPEIPVIMLTARTDEDDELFGFEIGVDDYVRKPFSPKVLTARVKTLLKKSNHGISAVYESGKIRADTVGHHIFLEDEQLELSPKEYELLICFMEHSGKVLTREMLLSQVWDSSYFGDLRTVDTHIKKLRKKLKNEGNKIQTVRGYGYRFDEE